MTSKVQFSIDAGDMGLLLVNGVDVSAEVESFTVVCVAGNAPQVVLRMRPCAMEADLAAYLRRETPTRTGENP